MIRRQKLGGRALRGIVGSWAIVVLPLTAHAQWAERDAGKVLFQSAREALAQGRREAACEMFEKSHALDPSAVGPLLNLADCEAKPGSLVRARSLFQEAFTALSDGDERKAVVAARLRALDSRVPVVTIERGNVGSAAVYLDDGPLDASASTLRLEPGRHRIVVTQDGRQNHTEAFDLAEGSTRNVVLRVGPPADVPAGSAPRLPTTPAPRLAGSFAPGLIVLGVGAAAVGAGVAARFAAAGEDRIVSDRCDQNLVCDSEGFQAASRGKMWTLVSSAALAAGAVTAGVGAYLVVSQWRSSRTKATLSAVPLGGAPGVHLRGEF